VLGPGRARRQLQLEGDRHPAQPPTIVRDENEA
jgi:hypothetical protein